MRKLLTPLLLALVLTTASGETITGRVVSIADGDTLTVLDSGRTQHKIRLAGFDAPEKRQAYGQRSKQSLSDLAFGTDVAIDSTKRDRYRRQIGKVLVDGHDVNMVQVERGLAWFYRQYQREQSPDDRKRYEAAEDAAKTENVVSGAILRRFRLGTFGTASRSSR